MMLNACWVTVFSSSHCTTLESTKTALLGKFVHLAVPGKWMSDDFRHAFLKVRGLLLGEAAVTKSLLC